MQNITTVISVNGWSNVWTILKADGYTGKSIVETLTVVNNSATAAYLHFTSDGSTNPATAANGLLVSTATFFAYTQDSPDLASTWINTGGALDIGFSVVGG